MLNAHPQLQELAALYFHQDYDREYSGADGALTDFASGYEPDFVAATVADIGQVLSENPTEEQLKSLWMDCCRSNFDPTTVGMSYREWFEHMLEVLREA